MKGQDIFVLLNLAAARRQRQARPWHLFLMSTAGAASGSRTCLPKTHDLETTGFGSKDRVVEVAVVCLDARLRVERSSPAWEPGCHTSRCSASRRWAGARSSRWWSRSSATATWPDATLQCERTWLSQKETTEDRLSGGAWITIQPIPVLVQAERRGNNGGA